MRRQYAKATAQWAQGVAGQPHHAASHGLAFRDTLQEVVEGNSMQKVDRGRTPWLVGRVAKPADHHLACYQLNQVVNASLDPYK
jgi:hypothetical protein